MQSFWGGNAVYKILPKSASWNSATAAGIYDEIQWMDIPEQQ